MASYTTSALLALFPDQQVEVLFAEMEQNEGASVDSKGRAVLRFSCGVTAYLEWAVGVAYKNEIDLWSAQGSLYTEKIFSKPAGYQPTILCVTLMEICLLKREKFVNNLRRCSTIL